MKETHYKLKHRVTALFAAAVMLCSMLPGAAFAEEPTPQPTEETVQMEQQTESSETDNGQTDESSPDPGEDVTEATPETAEEQPAEEEIPAAVVGAELYTDLPNAPIGSYIGSEGLPVATGETKIGISEWPESQLEETSGSYLTAAALDNDGLTMAAPLLDGADYAIVPIMAQVEYPADGSSTDMILPDGVTLQDFYGEPATDADALLHNSYHETSAAVMGVYVQAAADFNAQLVYTGPDGSTQTKTLYVTIDREHTVASPFADAGIAAYGERPIPDVTSGKITKVAKVNGTWLIWFNGEPAYCCTPGADGQPKNCPTYTYVNTSMVGADQYVPGDHYGNQYRIWGGLTQLSLGMQELPPVALSAEAPSLLDFCRTIYTNAQMQIIENYPDSTAAKILMGSAQTLLEGTDAYASARGYYTYIYQPGRAGWQTVAVIGPEISDDEPNPKPIVQEIYANWEAPAQTASGSFDFDYGIITDKVQLKTTEKVDGATIEIEPITKSGTIDGGTWNISPADKQSVTTAGHTNDDNFQNNGGAASASWTLHYSVSKTTDSRSGRVGPYTTQDEADAAADSARDAAIAELQGEAQRMVDNAVASAKAELANVKFRYEEVGVPYGFEMYWGSNGSNQTISVPANSNNAYQMKNDEWSLQVNIRKTDSETGNQIAADAQYEIFQWDTVTGKYQPTGGYNTYSVQRQGDGTYAVINSAAYATTDSMRHTLYYTQRNAGKFIIVETKAPTGYFGDWTDINHPGMANTPLGKRGYYIEITEDSDNSVIWLDNADYNADIAATDKGGTKLVTSTGVETTVTIYDTAKDPRRTYNTDNSGKAANEDSYTITPTDGVMKNDRTLGEISISKVDLDAVRYVGGSAAHGTALASGQAHGDASLDGAVYDLYAAEDITHPDGVTGVVDYSKIVDADGNPIWHTTIRDNSGQWVSDYLPVLKKDHLVASAKIENGWLCFSNLYLGKYYVVERSTGVVIPLREGALAVSGTYPTVDSRTKAVTGQTAALAKNGSGQYTDWVYKNQFSTVSKGKALDGSWTYDAYYLSFADGYLCDEHNYYITPAYDFLSVIHDGTIGEVTLAIKDTDGNTVTTWVSTDEPHRVTGLHFGESYTLTEIRAADGYALADNITFRLIQKTDEGGNPLEECEVYYLTTKNILFWKWDDWRLLDDATVIMRDDITKVQISKKDLTTKEELPGAELTLTDEKGNEIDRWVSTDAPHYMERLPAGKYTLTEVTAPDGYAIAERVEFEVLPTGEVQTFEMFDDTIKVKISKVDITTNEELPGAELVIKDKDGTEIDRWISTNGPHYVEKMPAGDYTLTEITAPNGYKVAESIDFTVLPTGEMQTVVMKDAREDTPTPTPDNTPTPDHTPQPTPNTTPAPTPVPAAPTATPTPLLTIPKTGDNSSLGLLLAIAGISLAGLAVLIHKSARRKDIAPRDDDDEDTED